MNRCILPNCGKYITKPFWICRACEERWKVVGVDFRNWPAWIKALVQIERRKVYVDSKLITIPLPDDL